MTSSFPKSLDTIYGGGEQVAKYVAEMTDNKFQIQVFAAGEIVPGLRHLTQPRTAPSRCATPCRLLCRQGSDLAIYASVPFASTRGSKTPGVPGGGEQLGNEFFKKSNVIGFPCGKHRHPDGRLVPQERSRPLRISPA